MAQPFFPNSFQFSKHLVYKFRPSSISQANDTNLQGLPGKIDSALL